MAPYIKIQSLQLIAFIVLEKDYTRQFNTKMVVLSLILKTATCTVRGN